MAFCLSSFWWHWLIDVSFFSVWRPNSVKELGLDRVDGIRLPRPVGQENRTCCTDVCQRRRHRHDSQYGKKQLVKAYKELIYDRRCCNAGNSRSPRTTEVLTDKKYTCLPTFKILSALLAEVVSLIWFNNDYGSTLSRVMVVIEINQIR